MFTLIEQGEVYGPDPLGKTSVLLNSGTILKIGDIDARTIEQLDKSVTEVVEEEDKAESDDGKK